MLEEMVQLSYGQPLYRIILQIQMFMLKASVSEIPKGHKSCLPFLRGIKIAKIHWVHTIYLDIVLSLICEGNNTL